MNAKVTRVVGIASVRMECRRAQCLYENGRQHEEGQGHQLQRCGGESRDGQTATIDAEKQAGQTRDITDAKTSDRRKKEEERGDGATAGKQQKTPRRIQFLSIGMSKMADENAPLTCCAGEDDRIQEQGPSRQGKTPKGESARKTAGGQITMAGTQYVSGTSPA